MICDQTVEKKTILNIRDTFSKTDRKALDFFRNITDLFFSGTLNKVTCTQK